MQLMLLESTGRSGSIYVRHLNAIGDPIPGCFELLLEGEALWAWDHITYAMLLPFVGQRVKVSDTGVVTAMRNQRQTGEGNREGSPER